MLFGSQIHGGKQVPTDLSAIQLVNSVRRCWVILSSEIETSVVVWWRAARLSSGAPCWAGGDPAVLVGTSVGHCCQHVKN